MKERFEQFFDQHESDVIELRSADGKRMPVTMEELYQHFKMRLLAEVEAYRGD